MTQRSIRAMGIGKRYAIGAAPESYKTLRDSIAKAVLAPVRAARALSGGGVPESRTIWALRDISFEARPGEVIGFIGRNGAGKSTLLKVLSRITDPTEGRAEIHGRVGSLLEVGTGFHPELTGRENVYLSGAILGMSKADIDRKFDLIVTFSEIEKFVDTPVKHYSSGMYLRMAFAVAAHLDPEILLVDEVLAVGDASFQKKCLTKMVEVSRAGQTVLFVSHNLDAVLTLCSRCIVLSEGRISYDGGPAEAIAHYHRLLSPMEGRLDESVIYQESEKDEAAAKKDAPRVTRIEARDEDGNPNGLLRTWDDVTFRIHYWAPADVADGSMVFDIRDYKEQRLMVLDSGPSLGIRAGHHCIECRLPRLPLPSGEYFITVGLTNPYVDWMWRGYGIASMRVHGKDVYGIGRPPSYSRMTMAAEYSYRHAAPEVTAELAGEMR